MGLNDTPSASRLHIGIFGKRNAGKSTLVNAITGQNTAVVSDTPGTTTDPVYKAIEINAVGPCVLIDTAGFDDEGKIGQLRLEKTRLAAEKSDIAIIVFAEDMQLDEEKRWIAYFKEKNIPVITVLNKSELIKDIEAARRYIEKNTGLLPIVLSAKSKGAAEQIRAQILRNLPQDYDTKTITGSIVNDGDTVMLVMPQDIQAPKGRLILPQVQTIRELLDRKCIVISVTTDKLDEALSVLKAPPQVIITDSQVFKAVYEKKPYESKLTSFSVLFAGYKGDIDYFVKSAYAIESLTEGSRVLIAEACTHAPSSEDIGREKIPRLLRKKVGDKLIVDIVSGTDFPHDLTQYDLIIHCGACMFNRRYVMSRIAKAKEKGVPMTNYGVAIACLSGILDKIAIS